MKKSAEIQTFSAMSGHALIEARLVEGHPSVTQRRDSPLVYIQPRYLVACRGEPGGCHNAQASEPDDRDIQRILPFQCRRSCPVVGGMNFVT